MNTALLDSKIWKCEAFKPQPVPETIWPILSRLDPKPLTNWQGVDVSDVQEVRQPMMEGCLLCFYTDKIEKLTVGFQSFMGRMVMTPIVITPNDDYDFPIFSAEFIENPGGAHLLVDMHPLRDLVIESWYREKYLDPVEPIWKEYLDVDTGPNPNVWFRTFVSPFSIGGRPKVAGGDRSGLARTAECLTKYIEYYVDHVIPNAEPARDAQGKEFAIKKKNAIRETYKTKDPGAGPLVKTLGVEMAKKYIHALF